jgi:arylsulfatase A-like enzyme
MFRTLIYFAIYALACLSAPASDKSADKPNIVFILSDDQGWTDYGFMGHPDIHTPNLDHLAEQSLVFERGYVTSPLCRPSLASMVTGLYPFQHGVTGNDVDGRNNRAKLDLPVRESFHQHASLIRSLTSDGYLTHQSGKWWEGSYKDGGFTHGMTHGVSWRGGRHGDAGLKIGREGMEPVTDFIDLAIKQDKPFFIWYAPFLPHTPHNPPENILAKYAKEGRPDDQAKYYAMCEWFDQTCGQLLDHLEKRGIADNTVIVYICDNGWAARSTNAEDPNQEQWGNYALRSKGSPFEMGVRTPIMLSWKGRITPGRSDQLAQSIDLFPTLAALAGVEVPDELPGINLLDRQAVQNRAYIFGECNSIHNMTPGNPNDTLKYLWCVGHKWKLIERFNGVDTTGYKRVHAWDQQAVRLYDIQADPHEKVNLADKYPDQVSLLNKQIRSWHPMNDIHPFEETP